MEQPELFAVYHATQCSSTAVTNLTKSGVVHHIYTDDGNKYWLEPCMVTSDIYNDEPSGSGEPVQAGEGDQLEWDVWFKDNNRPAKNSNFVAYGANEESATEGFLDLVWSTKWFNTEKWVITPMDEFNAEAAINEATVGAIALIDAKEFSDPASTELADELHDVVYTATNHDSVKNQAAVLAAIDQFLKDKGF